jgi:ABC transporter substrate binding protein
MRRREFITLIGGGAVTWPLAARAQQRLPVIGFLHEGLAAPLSLTTAFQQGLIEAGISAGSSLRIENRSAEGQYERLPALAADLIEQRVGIIIAVYLVAARAAKAATQAVPIVFVIAAHAFACLRGGGPESKRVVVARRIGREAGLRYVYTGNIHDPAAAQTRACHPHRLFRRDSSRLLATSPSLTAGL